jgi:hypothetical protein
VDNPKRGRKKQKMGEAAVKKDNHHKKVIAGRVSLETHEEIYRRAAVERRPVSQWLELALEHYLSLYPAKPALPVSLVPPADDDAK